MTLSTTGGSPGIPVLVHSPPPGHRFPSGTHARNRLGDETMREVFVLSMVVVGGVVGVDVDGRCSGGGSGGVVSAGVCGDVVQVVMMVTDAHGCTSGC